MESERLEREIAALRATIAGLRASGSRSADTAGFDVPSAPRSERNTQIFDTTLATITDFAHVFDHEGRFVFASRAFATLLDLTEGEILGKTFFELPFPPQVAARFHRQILAVFETGDRVVDETPLTSPSGHEGYYEYIFNPVIGADGRVGAVVGSTRDITRRTHSDEALQASEARARGIFECITDAFFALDRDWRFTYVNPQGEAVLDRAPGDLMGRVIWDVYPGLAGSEFERTYHRVVAERVDSSFTAYYPDHQRWYEVHAYPAPAGITVYFRDVTERMAVDAALRASEDRYRTLFTAMDQGFCVVEMIFDAEDRPVDYRFVETNPAFTSQSGLRDAVGRTARELVPDLETHWFEVYGRVALTGEPARFVDEAQAMEGRWFDVYAFRLGAPELRQVAILFTDISERKRLEQARQDFVAMAGHDLGTPLTVLRGRAQIMQRRGVFDAAEIASILEQTRRMERLLADLRDVVRWETGKPYLRLEPEDLGVLAAAAAERALSSMSTHRIVVELPPAPVLVSVDRDRLDQVLDNLIGNAVKYSPAGREVQVRVANDGDEARLSVVDHGLGIEPAALPRLFDRFYRAAAAQHTSGLGLGLHISHQLVAAHGGRIWAESTPGRGSVFTVALPSAR